MRRVVAHLWQAEPALHLSRRAGTRVTPEMLRAETAHLAAIQMPGSDAARRARPAFKASGTCLARGAVRAWLRLVRDAHAGVRPRGVARLVHAVWCAGMVVEDDRRAPDRLSRCVLLRALDDHFWTVGRPDLMPARCAWDAGPLAAIGPSARPVRVDVLYKVAGCGEIREYGFRRRR